MNTKELRAAIISYPVGTKFSHPNFGDDEYIIADENRVAHTEDGYECSPEFWEIRKDWEGWYIKEDSIESTSASYSPFSPNEHDLYPYYLTNYYDMPSVKITYCNNCKKLRDDKTCPYSKKPIKNPCCTSCKYGVAKD